MIALVVAVASLTSPAMAGKSERDAEAYRLHAEIDRLSQKRAWSGVDRTYDRLMALKDVSVGTGAHLAGAQAAQERGDIAAAWERAQRAAAVATNPGDLEKASSWMADFYVNYGEVSIESSVSFKDALPLVSRDPTFNPVTRSVMDRAQAELDTNRAYRGFLPMGQYSVAGWDFDIAGGPLVKVFVKPGKAPVPSPSPTDTVAPTPVPSAPDRVVVLAARGAGWPADAWNDRAFAVREGLYGVEGVMAVDVFEPDDPWLVVDLDPERLAALPEPVPTPSEIAATLALTLELPPLVVQDNRLAVLPGVTDLKVLGQAVVVGGDAPMKLVDLGAVTEGSPGPLPVPTDPSAVARWRLEVRISGATPGVLEKLVPAANGVDGAPDLGLSLEAPPLP